MGGATFSHLSLEREGVEMPNKNQMMQRTIRMYMDETGQSEVDMDDVADFAVDRLGWPLPTPVNPRAQLAAQFAQAAREEMRKDSKTGRPYRANHAVPITQDGRPQGWLWFDIDRNPPRPRMHKSLINRREQIVGDALQLSFDADHWNSIHPNEEPIKIPLDFTDDVEWRKNGTGERSA